MFSKAPIDGPDKRLARYDHLIIHCSATPPTIAVDAKWVDYSHKQRGFSGCGYNAVVTRHGDWQDSDDGFPTRLIGRQGAHVGDCGPGWNGRSFGICLAGGVDKNDKPQMNYSESQLVTLEYGILHFLRLHPHPESVTIMGHRDLIKKCHAPPKACPCFDVTEWWIDLGHLARVEDRKKSRVVPAPSKVDEDMIAKNHISKLLLPETYTVQAGDSLFKISGTYGVTAQKIRELNNLKGDLIKVGQKLRLR